MLIDYHVHTIASDGSKDHLDYISQAIKIGLDEIGFSDHFNFKNSEWSMKLGSLEDYVDKINRIKDNSEIPVKLGLEVDFVPSQTSKISELLKNYQFDYLIGSVHFIGDWCIDSDKEINEWNKRNVDEVYEKYYKLVQKMAKFNFFDIVGHIDIVKKFNFFPVNDIDDIISETLGVIGKYGLCLDVNTSGLRKPCQEIYPNKKILEICFDNGIPITFGSDAHTPEHVGADFDKAVKLVRDAGYETITSFTKRKARQVEID